MPATPSPAASKETLNKEVLIEGVTLHKYSRKGRNRTTKICFDSGLNIIQWDEDKDFHVAQLGEVYVGCKTETFVKFPEANPEFCFSLDFGGKTLDFERKQGFDHASLEQFTTFLTAVHWLLRKRMPTWKTTEKSVTRYSENTVRDSAPYWVQAGGEEALDMYAEGEALGASLDVLSSESKTREIIESKKLLLTPPLQSRGLTKTQVKIPGREMARRSKLEAAVLMPGLNPNMAPAASKHNRARSSEWQSGSGAVLSRNRANTIQLEAIIGTQPPKPHFTGISKRQSTCSVSGCSEVPWKEGLCNKHYTEHQLPDEDLPLSAIINNVLGLRYFKEHMKTEYSSENINFWHAAEKYKRISDIKENEDRRLQVAKELQHMYIKSGGEQQVNVDSTLQAAVNKAVKSKKVTKDTFTQSQHEIYKLMSLDTFYRFKRSDLFKKFSAEKEAFELTKVEEQKQAMINMKVGQIDIAKQIQEQMKKTRTKTC